MVRRPPHDHWKLPIHLRNAVLSGLSQVLLDLLRQLHTDALRTGAKGILWDASFSRTALQPLGEDAVQHAQVGAVEDQHLAVASRPRDERQVGDLVAVDV